MAKIIEGKTILCICWWLLNPYVQLSYSSYFKAHITIHKPSDICGNSTYPSSPLPFCPHLTGQIKWRLYTPSCSSEKQSPCPIPVLSDPISHHVRPLLPQELWNLSSFLFPLPWPWSRLQLLPFQALTAASWGSPCLGPNSLTTPSPHGSRYHDSSRCNYVISLLTTLSGFPFPENTNSIWSTWHQVLPYQAHICPGASTPSTFTLWSPSGMNVIYFPNEQCALLLLLLHRGCSGVLCGTNYTLTYLFF